MRVMVIGKASRSSEAGVMPPQEDMEWMIRFNEAMLKAEILKSADGLKPSWSGKRVRFPRGGGPLVTDGPFAATRRPIAGYWVWDLKSTGEALEPRWQRGRLGRCPGVLDTRRPGDQPAGTYVNRTTPSPT